MVKHIISFKLIGTEAERKEIATKFKKAIEALPEQVDVLRSIEVGINENPAETWDVVLIAEFDSMEDLKTYKNHPAHKAAAGIRSGHTELRACVDYYC